MVFLLDLKEKFKKLYNDYNFVLVHLARFVVAFVSMMLINSYVGYMSKLNNIFVVIAVAVVATILPNGATIVILSICRKESSYPQMRPSVYAPHDMMQNP